MAKSKTKDSLESLEKNNYFSFIIYAEYKIINKEYFFSFYFLFFSLLKIFFKRVSLCSPGCPGICSEGQADLKLRVQLLLPPEYWD